MDYEQGIKLLPAFEGLKGKSLALSTDWIITNTALLPVHKDTLLAYIPILGWGSNGEWMANGVNHEFVYLSTGIYFRREGGHYGDDLNIYIIMKNTSNPLEVTYKADLFVNLVQTGEILREVVPNLIWQYL